jgi:hypothetical protein
MPRAARTRSLRPSPSCVVWGYIYDASPPSKPASREQKFAAALWQWPPPDLPPPCVPHHHSEADILNCLIRNSLVQQQGGLWPHSRAIRHNPRRNASDPTIPINSDALVRIKQSSNLNCCKNLWVQKIWTTLFCNLSAGMPGVRVLAETN